MTDPAVTLRMLRRWWKIRSDYAGTFTTPAERERAARNLAGVLAQRS